MAIPGEKMSRADELSGMVPAAIKVRQQRILIDSIEVMADIGFHDFEVGVPQRLLVSVEVWIDPEKRAKRDDQNNQVESRSRASGIRRD